MRKRECKSVEYHVEQIDEFGDVCDVNVCDTLQDAVALAKRSPGEIQVREFTHYLNAPNGRVIRTEDRVVWDSNPEAAT